MCFRLMMIDTDQKDAAEYHFLFLLFNALITGWSRGKSIAEE
jgi:hypothetical protein